MIKRIGEESKLQQIEAWDIKPASDLQKDLDQLNEYLLEYDLSPIQLAQTVGHQPQNLINLAYEILKRQIPVEIDDVLVLPGSSMIAIYYVLSIAFQNHYQKFHDGIFGSISDPVSSIQNQKKLSYKKPCVIGIEGSFKCGGSFPYLLGGELVYAQSSGEKFTVTAASIKEAFDSAQKSDRVPVAFIWEEPTALGFILRDETLAEIAELLKEYLAKYPDMIILIDAYNGGLFREDKIPSLYEDTEIRKNAIYTTSMRKKIPAANWGLITPIACGNKILKEKLSLFFGSNSFYTVSQFSQLETLVASQIMEKFLQRGGSVEYQFNNFDYAAQKIAQINQELGKELMHPYANPEAGINYFIQFDSSFLEQQSCRDAQHLCQGLSLITGLHCSIPSAMGIPGFGVRINLMRGQQALTLEGFNNSQEYIDEALNRLKYFLLALEKNIFSFKDLEEIIASDSQELENFSDQIISAQNNFLTFMNGKNSKLVSVTH
ncbi:MAG: hypothetical protein F6J86_07505 [Symploca sp. SIO1B1]|nr:hypothetical protein [Symploca sp. SIO1C2]NER93673.1 hypothetical protein [Symploca sp. SIO1B1]